jgi:hypothetical protein
MTRDQSRIGPTPAGQKPKFTPADFLEIIDRLPVECPLVGGQAVALWAERYGLVGDEGQSVTSADIDFWGSRGDLMAMAKSLKRKAIFPHQYEMTVWAGAIEITIAGRKTLVEFLHTIPGLDTNDPDKASVKEGYPTGSVRKMLSVLTPVSLVLAKLHALRHFDQKEREDELHLRVCLQASNRFLQELLGQREVRQVLWNCERLIAAAHLKPYRRLQSQHKLDVLNGIPIDEMRRERASQNQSAEDRRRLSNFVNVRWKEV